MFDSVRGRVDKGHRIRRDRNNIKRLVIERETQTMDEQLAEIEWA
jgi:hypothetical protein